MEENDLTLTELNGLVKAVGGVQGARDLLANRKIIVPVSFRKVMTSDVTVHIKNAPEFRQVMRRAGYGIKNAGSLQNIQYSKAPIKEKLIFVKASAAQLGFLESCTKLSLMKAAEEFGLEPSPPEGVYEFRAQYAQFRGEKLLMPVRAVDGLPFFFGIEYSMNRCKTVHDRSYDNVFFGFDDQFIFVQK